MASRAPRPEATLVAFGVACVGAAVVVGAHQTWSPWADAQGVAQPSEHVASLVLRYVALAAVLTLLVMARHTRWALVALFWLGAVALAGGVSLLGTKPDVPTSEPDLWVSSALAVTIIDIAAIAAPAIAYALSPGRARRPMPRHALPASVRTVRALDAGVPGFDRFRTASPDPVPRSDDAATPGGAR